MGVAHFYFRLQSFPARVVLIIMASCCYLGKLDTNSLPIRMRVCNGSCGIETNDQLELYFVKYTKMVEVMSSSGKRYMVPVSSSMKCCVLYDPEHDVRKAIKGYTFGSASELARAKPLPSIVQAETGFYDDKGSESSLHPGDILVLSGKTPQAKGGEIICTDIETRVTKTIISQTACPFTTSPSALYMLLSNFIYQIETPVTIVFELLLKHGKMDTYTIINVLTATSVIGRMKNTDGSETNHNLIELFMDVPLRVEILGDQQHDNTPSKKLQNNAQTAFKMFRPQTPRKTIINELLYDNDDTQRLLLDTISIDQWNSHVYLQPLEF